VNNNVNNNNHKIRHISPYKEQAKSREKERGGNGIEERRDVENGYKSPPAVPKQSEDSMFCDHLELELDLLSNAVHQGGPLDQDLFDKPPFDKVPNLGKSPPPQIGKNDDASHDANPEKENINVQKTKILLTRKRSDSKISAERRIYSSPQDVNTRRRSIGESYKTNSLDPQQLKEREKSLKQKEEALLALQSQLRQRETQVFVLEEQTIELLENEDKRLKDKEKQLRNWERMLRKEVKKLGDQNGNGNGNTNGTATGNATTDGNGNDIFTEIENSTENDSVSNSARTDDSDGSVITEGNENNHKPVKQKKEKRKSREHCCVS